MCTAGGRATALACALVAAACNLAPSSASAQVPEGQGALPADTFPRPPISAGGAFFRSLVIPGWGQAELGQESRGAFYFLAEAASLWMWLRTERRLDHAQRTEPENSSIVRAREQQREDWITLTVFWALFNAADAWVSVQLYGFEERTKVGEVEARAIPGAAGPSVLLTWKLPI